MKTLITAIAATLFTAAATTVSAAEVYQGFAGNPDLIHQYNAVETVAVQPGIGSDVDRYHGIADGNSDLFNVMIEGPTNGGDPPRIYSGAQGNPDLSF
ncbi:MAG: hypothetical protein WBG92_00720 [Thiohalocapsa sp.]